MCVCVRLLILCYTYSFIISFNCKLTTGRLKFWNNLIFLCIFHRFENVFVLSPGLTCNIISFRFLLAWSVPARPMHMLDTGLESGSGLCKPLEQTGIMTKIIHDLTKENFMSSGTWTQDNINGGWKISENILIGLQINNLLKLKKSSLTFILYNSSEPYFFIHSFIVTFFYCEI